MYDDDGNDELVTMTRSYAIISVASFEDEKDKIAFGEASLRTEF